MNESHVTSLELSKKLKELGLKQNTLFCWISDNDLEFLDMDCRNNEVCCAAFLASELGEMLPSIIQSASASGSDYPLNICKRNSWYLSYGHGHIKFAYAHENLSIIMAVAIIWAIENNLVTSEWREKWLEK